MNHKPPTAQPLTRRRILAGVCLGGMGAAAAGAHWLKPTESLAAQLGPIRLSESVPTRFGAWREDNRQVSGIVNPQQTEQLAKLYSEMLSRVYVHDDGYRIMLSIAYGGDQSDSFQLHYPDACYPAQGFQLISRHTDQLKTPYGTINVSRLETSLGSSRPEPVSYWAMIGVLQAGLGLEKKRAELGYSLRGIVPDGLLLRVSSIDPNTLEAYLRQNAFLLELLEKTMPSVRQRLAGL